METAHQRLAQQAHLAGLFLAITGCFLVYSVIQERLMTLGFGPEGERFEHSLFIILVNRLVAVAVTAAALALLGKSLHPAAPLPLFTIPSIANVISSSSQYEALKYVSFPLQALAKCAKTVPVMVWGLVLGGRKYDAIDYICALTVTAGCAVFVLTGSIAAPQQLQEAAAELGEDGADLSSTWMLYGLALLAAFLIFDGLTSTAQDKLFAQYDMHSCNQLLWVSLWSAGLSLAFLMAGSQLMPAVYFVLRHPSCMGYILMLSVVSTAVQLFIFYTIQRYGALHFALIMTIRQFLSIVLSCVVFKHDLSPSQWMGTALVIGGLVARGMHRGGLERTSKKTPAVSSLLLKSAGHSASASLQQLLPLAAAVPVIAQTSMGQELAVTAGVVAGVAAAGGPVSAATSAAAAAAAAKRDAGGIALDVHATTKTVGSVATRRKAPEAA